MAVTPAGSSPSTLDGHPLRPDLRQRLGGQHVLDLARADAEGQRAERAVRGRVAVAADDRHARQRASLLGPDDVDDALAGVAHRVQRDPELRGVLAQHLDLAGRDRIGDRLVDVRRRHVVVLGGDGELGSADVPSGQAQPVERLRAGDLVDEVEVDVEQVRLAGRRAHDVAVPDLLRQRLGWHVSHSGWAAPQTPYARIVTATSEIVVDAPLPGDWADQVRELARQRDAVILAHNYQVPEIQEVADHVGDSLGLSRVAAAAEASTIVFCGVHFMAETAKILSYDKTVLIPDDAPGAASPRRSPPISCGRGRPSTRGRSSSATSTRRRP